MANKHITPQIIANEALMGLENNSLMLNMTYRGLTEDFNKPRLKNSSVDVLVPFRARTGDGADITGDIQDFEEKLVTFKVDIWKHAALQFSAQQLTLEIGDFYDRVIKDPIEKLAADVDIAILKRYLDVANIVGTPGTVFDTFDKFLAIPEMMDSLSIPQGDRTVMFDVKNYYKMLSGLKGLYEPTMVAKIIQSSALGRIADTEIMRSNNVHNHIAGSMAGSPLINGVGQTGASINVDGFTASTLVLKQGDVIQIAGCNAVNPVNYFDLGFYRHFVVTGDVTSDGAGAAVIPIDPPITTAGGFQNVTAAPADNAVITGFSSHKAALAFHKKAFAHVVVPIELPDGLKASRATSKKGVSVSYTSGTDIKTFETVRRVDVLFGAKCINPELATRVVS